MRRVADGIYRQVTRRKTKGGVKTYVYYYKRSETLQRRKFERVSYTVARRQEELTTSDIGEIMANVDDPILKQQLRNELAMMRRKKQAITAGKIESLIQQGGLSKQQQFIRNLGYSEAEFEAQTGLTAADLSRGTFENDNGTIIFISEGGEVRYFDFDYEKGLIEL